MAVHIPKGSKGIVVKDRYGNQTIKVVSKDTKTPTKWKTGDKYGPTTKEAKAKQNNNKSSSRSSSSKKLTKTDYRDINSMTPDEARQKGYKYSGAVGWYKVGTEEKESLKRIKSAPPTPPKLKKEIIKRGSISQQQVKDGGFQLSGATGELMRTPGTNENIKKSRQYLRDLNRYYDKQIRNETNRPAGTSNNYIYELDGKTVTRTQYIKSLRDARANIIKNQKQTLQMLKDPTPQRDTIKIQLPTHNPAKNEVNSLIPNNIIHPNDSTRTDINWKRKDIFTREQQIDRDVSRAVIDNSNPLNRFGVKLATMESYKGKMYIGSILGESRIGQKLGLKGSNKAGHIKTHKDIEADYITEIRKRTARETQLKDMLSGKKPLTAPTEFLRAELKNINRAERDLYLKNMVSNPITQASAIALTPTIIGASPLLTSVASNPGVLMGTTFLGAKEVARVSSEYKAGNYASALGEVSTVGTGLIVGGSIAGIKYANKKTTTLQHIDSFEKINTYGNKNIKVGKGHATYDLTLNDRSNLDKLFGRPGKTRHETYRGKLDVLLNKNNAVLKIDIMNNKNVIKGDFIHNKELNSQLVHIRHGKISPDNILSDTSKLNFKIKSPTMTHQATTRTQLIQSNTKAKVSTTSLNKDFVIKDTFSHLKVDVFGNNKNLKLSSIHQSTIKPTDKIDLLTTIRNLNHNKVGKTTRETSFLNTKAKRTTIDEVLYNLKSNGKYSLKHQNIKQSTVHKSNGQTFQPKAPNKNSVFNLGSGITKSQQLKHRPTLSSKMITANTDYHITLTNHFNKISSLRPPKVPIPKPTVRATANKILTNKRKGGLNPVQRTTTYQNNKLNILLNDITPPHTIPPTPKAPQLSGRASLINQNMLKMGSQSAIRNAYLHKPAVNTANFGRIAMTSLNAISVITQKSTKDKVARSSRIKTPNKLIPNFELLKTKQRNNIININLLKLGQNNIQIPKNKIKTKYKQKYIQPPQEIYFNPLPKPSINIIPRIDTPTPRGIRLPGGNKELRIRIPKKTKTKTDTGLNVIERKLKDINSII